MTYSFDYYNDHNFQELFQQGFDINQKKSSGTLLHHASKNGHLRLVQELIHRGCDVNSENMHKETPLYYAVGHGHLEIIRFLITHGADINARCVQGRSPLHIGATSKSVEILQELLKNGANANAQDNNGSTPIFGAVFNAYYNNVEILLHYTDLSIEDKLERTLLDVSYNFELTELIVSYINSLDVKEPVE